MGRYQFWIYNKDDEGRPLDETIVKTAEDIRSTLIQYRQKEIDCDSTVNTMLQGAVEAASKASRKNKIRNPKGYLVTVYHRLVDEFLDEQRQWMPTEDSVLEHLANKVQRISWEDTINDRLVLRKLMDAMDAETRQICYWRLNGYSMNEIARELSVTPKLLSKRYRSGLKKAAKKTLR